MNTSIEEAITRKHRKRSQVWKYFIEVDNKTAKCIKYNAIVRINGHTNSMISHLWSKHLEVDSLFHETKKILDNKEDYHLYKLITADGLPLRLGLHKFTITMIEVKRKMKDISSKNFIETIPLNMLVTYITVREFALK